MAEIYGWDYYKHAYLSTNAPHEDVDVSAIESGEFWNNANKSAYFARWTSEYDCGYETEWWYVIKDEPFDITALNSKKRYKINRGKKYFDVYQIDPSKYKDAIYQVQVEAYSDYPEKYRPTVNKERVFSVIENDWAISNVKVFAAFHRESGDMAGYIQLLTKGKCIESIAQKAIPKYEKFQVNYALLAAVLDDHAMDLSNGSYICVGSRNVVHETAFQDFVEDIFSFRKAYCKLNVSYNPSYKAFIKILYSFRKILKKFDSVGVVHKINGVMKMEEIIRKQERQA